MFQLWRQIDRGVTEAVLTLASGGRVGIDGRIKKPARRAEPAWGASYHAGCLRAGFAWPMNRGSVNRLDLSVVGRPSTVAFRDLHLAHVSVDIHNYDRAFIDGIRGGFEGDLVGS